MAQFIQLSMFLLFELSSSAVARLFCWGNHSSYPKTILLWILSCTRRHVMNSLFYFFSDGHLIPAPCLFVRSSFSVFFIRSGRNSKPAIRLDVMRANLLELWTIYLHLTWFRQVGWKVYWSCCPCNPCKSRSKNKIKASFFLFCSRRSYNRFTQEFVKRRKKLKVCFRRTSSGVMMNRLLPMFCFVLFVFYFLSVRELLFAKFLHDRARRIDWRNLESNEKRRRAKSCLLKKKRTFTLCGRAHEWRWVSLR